MEDLAIQIRDKMGAAGLSTAAIDAFLFQYRKLELNEAGLIPEDIDFSGKRPSLDRR